MKFSIVPLMLCAALLVSSIPTSHTSLSIRDLVAISEPELAYSDLAKRKGGGGGRGGGGGGGGTKGGSSSGTKGGSSGGTSSNGRPLSSYSFGSQSNAGGRTRDGSGPPPPYSGHYAGGAAVPYTSGARSPTRGILPYAAPIGAFAFFPGLWLYGSLWAYPYGYPYHYYDNGQNRTANVTCLCQRYSVCGCDPQNNQTFLEQVINNGTMLPVNTTASQFVTWPNGTSIAYINGTLPNGTTASGGTDPSNANEVSGAARLAIDLGGYWVMAATVVGAVLWT